MKVPDTNTFSLQDVYNSVHGHTSNTLGNLQSCFDNAISYYFDTSYNQDSYAPANSMLRFRNYTPTSATFTNVVITSTRLDCNWSLIGFPGTSTEHGMVFSTSPDPTTSDLFNKITIPDNPGYTGQITGALSRGGFSPNTTYYMRVYVITQYGTFYSENLQFTTLP